MEDTGNGKMIVITGGKVNDANVLVDRIAKLTAAHYLSAVEYELSKRTEQQIRCTLMNLYRERKYWEAVGVLMEIFKELGNPMDIANMVLYLCSDKAGFITGENICIDGGVTKLMIYHEENGWT